jgi:plastocyanin
MVIQLPPGRYYFQCDPHVGHGMVGHLLVVSAPAMVLDRAKP